MPKLSGGSVSQSSAISQQIYPLEQEIKRLENKILEFETKLKILKKNIETFEELKEKVNNIISYTDKSRLTGCIRDVTNIKKQISLTKKSKILSAITQLKQRLTQCENSFITSEEEDNSRCEYSK